MSDTPNADIEASQYPPIRHRDGTWTLWHPDSPGVRLRLRPSLLRRLRLIRSPFATLGETRRHYRETCPYTPAKRGGDE